MDARQAYIQKYTQRYGSAPTFLSPAPSGPIYSDSQSNSDVTSVIMPKTPRPVPLPMPVTPPPQPQVQPPYPHGHGYGRGGRHRSSRAVVPPHRVRHHRMQHSYGHHRHPAPLPITPAPVVTTGKTCPTWGYMVRTNPDGSETVVQCQPGSVAAAGLHGLDGLFDEVSSTMQGALGQNWMLYVGGAALAYFLFFKKGRR